MIHPLRTLRPRLSFDWLLAILVVLLALAYLIVSLTPSLARWSHRNVKPGEPQSTIRTARQGV